MLVLLMKNIIRLVRIKVRISIYFILCLISILIGIFYELVMNLSVNKIFFEDLYKLLFLLICCLLEVIYICIVFWYNVINIVGNYV